MLLLHARSALPRLLLPRLLLLLLFLLLLGTARGHSEKDGGEDSFFRKLGSRLDMGRGRGSDAPGAEEEGPPVGSDFASLMAREMMKNLGGSGGHSVEKDSAEEFELLKERFKVPRSFARPVERVLDILSQTPRNSFFPQHPDYYSLLGVSKYASDKHISQQYRKLAKALHPDKNPHPDAKTAFDAVADAHVQLSDPVTRGQYDQSVAQNQEPGRSMRRAWSRAQESVRNFQARQLLLLSRVRGGQGREEFALLRENIQMRIAGWKQAIVNFYYKMKFAPTLVDKLTLIGEVLWTKKINVAIVVLLLLRWTIIAP